MKLIKIPEIITSDGQSSGCIGCHYLSNLAQDKVIKCTKPIRDGDCVKNKFIYKEVKDHSRKKSK